MLLSADSLMIIFVKIYCYWTRTVGVIAKGSRGPVFFETQCICSYHQLWLWIFPMVFARLCAVIQQHIRLRTMRYDETVIPVPKRRGRSTICDESCSKASLHCGIQLK